MGGQFDSSGDEYPRHRRASFLQAKERIHGYHKQGRRGNNPKFLQHGNGKYQSKAAELFKKNKPEWHPKHKGGRDRVKKHHQNRDHRKHFVAEDQIDGNSILSSYQRRQIQHRLNRPDRRASSLGLIIPETPSPKAPYFVGPRPPTPSFGFQGDRPWTMQDPLLLHILTAADPSIVALKAHLLSYSEPEQFGIMRFLFTAAEPIPVGRYSSSGALQSVQLLNEFATSVDPFHRAVADIFYGQNTFLFLTWEELCTFIMNTPAQSLALIRCVQLGSEVVRRRPRARTSHKTYTDEDIHVQEALARMPLLSRVQVMLGFDIDDKFHRVIVGDDWCGQHPSLPELEVIRLDDQTHPDWSGDKDAVLAEDNAYFGSAFAYQMKKKRARRDEKMQIDTM